MAKKGQAVRVQQVKKKSTSKGRLMFVSIAKKLWQPRLFAMLAVFIAIVIVLRSIQPEQMWPVKSVIIEGEFNYLDKERLRQQALPKVNGGLFTVNLIEVRNALIDLAWVEDVSVRRQWPDKLSIRVIEQQPVVYWGESGVLSAKGKLFTPEKKLEADLPRLAGPEGQHKAMLKEMARMQAWLLDTELYIQSMTLDARRSWTLELSGDVELRLGRKQMHERLNRFVSIYKKHLKTDKREIRHIDMRYTNGFAVAWKEA